MVVVVVVVVVVIDGSRTEWPAEFYKKEGSPDAIRSEHSGYCSVTHPFSRVPKILYDEYLTDARRILRTTRDFYLVRVLQVSAVPGMYRRPNDKTYRQYWVLTVFSYCGYSQYMRAPMARMLPLLVLLLCAAYLKYFVLRVLAEYFALRALASTRITSRYDYLQCYQV